MWTCLPSRSLAITAVLLRLGAAQADDQAAVSRFADEEAAAAGPAIVQAAALRILPASGGNAWRFQHLRITVDDALWHGMQAPVRLTAEAIAAKHRAIPGKPAGAVIP